MNRFRFRCWDTEEKKMSKTWGFADLYGYEGECNAVTIKDGFTLAEHDNDEDSSPASKWGYPQFATENGIPKSLVIMQFTGLYDKNRREVCEGDVLALPNYDNWVIVWKPASFHLYNIKNSNTIYPLIQTFDREIIGNIYENPELLEGGK